MAERKPVPASAGARNARRPLLRLLRQALVGPLHIARKEGAQSVLASAGGQEVVVADAVLAEACRRGLLMQSGRHLVAAPEARAFLRRALSEGEADQPFQDQHRELEAQTILLEGARQQVRRNVTESPLGAVARLKEKDGSPFLPAEAIEAGERLAADFERGGLQPRVTASWEPRLAAKSVGARSAAPDLTDSARVARRRLARALDAMGPELSGVALDVCCFAKGLETVERERQWPARSAKLMLRTALLALSRHYAPPVTRTATRQWGADDFRPGLG